MNIIRTRVATVSALVLTLSVSARGAGTAVVENSAYRLAARLADGQIVVTLDDRLLGLRAADGPYIYRAELASERGKVHGLHAEGVSAEPNRLTIRGRLAGLDFEQVFTLPAGRPLLEEQIRLRNGTASPVALANLEAGFQRQVADQLGRVLPELAGDRWAAVPLRHRADVPRAFDFSLQELTSEPGREYRPSETWDRKRVVQVTHQVSEGWAWTHGRATLGVFSFSQELMRYSVAAPEQGPSGIGLRFGGFTMVSSEPAALTRIAPGQVVDLGVTRYQTVQGGVMPAALAFRAMLDERGCRFPAGYNPPVHWEQLYDMEGAWDDRLHRYTRATVEKEAAKGRDYQCEALYLDPGWDTTFGSFLWGQDWLGPRREFAEKIRKSFGLTLALHCPMPPWASTRTMPMGPFGLGEWPSECRRTPPRESPGEQQASDDGVLVPAVRGGCRNLALLPAVKATASSTIPGHAVHTVAHLNDGWYGNGNSWVAAAMPAWVEIDLGAVYSVSQVWLSNDQRGEFTDRGATKLQILAAADRDPSSSAAAWKMVAQDRDSSLLAAHGFAFDSVPARWIRVEVAESNQGAVRFDEIEVYEAKQVSPAEASAFADTVRRGPRAAPRPPSPGPEICMGSRQFLAAAEQRLLSSCADGAVFLMFDGTWWNGPCTAADHGHPIPYRMEDHMRACLDLAQRVHARYPLVLIEMHDMLAGGSNERMTPVYYKYGLPGSYDENWGFELMWDPMADLRSGRARTLYDYNLGCNVPVYLHIDLRKDNEHCVVLWWYASTCRHLGIGGTHARPAVVRAQQDAMRRYRELERFYKRGEFYGINEEIHVHVLPREPAMVVNLFNLSDHSRKVSGRIALRDLGLDPAQPYSSSEPWAAIKGSELRVERELPAWSAQVAEIQARP